MQGNLGAGREGRWVPRGQALGRAVLGREGGEQSDGLNGA